VTLDERPFVTTNAYGLAIGLTISIVDAHGGATFTVTLRRSESTFIADALH
jgi:hypothetical protein